MSHTTGTDKVTFHHNGDFSGDVTIVEQGTVSEVGREVQVPFEDLEFLMATKVRKELIAAIEDLDLEQEHARKALRRARDNADTIFRIAGR